MTDERPGFQYADGQIVYRDRDEQGRRRLTFVAAVYSNATDLAQKLVSADPYVYADEPQNDDRGSLGVPAHA